MDLRSEFLLRPGVVYLNHGSFGACPRPVFESYQRWQRELEIQPVEFLQRRLHDHLEASRVSLSEYIGAEPEDVLLVTNASMALNIVARSLKLEPGDEVLTTDHEYGSMDRMWEAVCERSGARYVRMAVTLPVQDQSEVADAIWSGVSTRTKVLFVSHITSSTALILPVAELIRRAREAGIISIVDGAHAPGQLPLDLSNLGSDFYAGNCHKWMMAPKGAGFLHARREVHDLLVPLIGGGSRAKDARSRLIGQHEYQGTRDLSALLSIPDAIRFAEKHDWASVRLSCHELVRYARDQTEAMTGLPSVVPDSPDCFAQMAILPVPRCDGHAVHTRLHTEFGIEIPIVGWRDMQFARISVQGYNTRSDVDALVQGLDAALPTGGSRG